MVGVFVAFIRVVYGRMIYMSLPNSDHHLLLLDDNNTTNIQKHEPRHDKTNKMAVRPV